MVRKVSSFLCVCVVLISAICGTALAHEPYNGNMSNTYVQYFKDIVSGIGFNENYVAYRSGQNEYVLIVGDIEYDGTTFNLMGQGTVYTIGNDDSYNSSYHYNVSSIENYSVTPGDKIVYADLGSYPELIDRGAKYETLTTVLLAIAMLYCIIRGVFFKR